MNKSSLIDKFQKWKLHPEKIKDQGVKLTLCTFAYQMQFPFLEVAYEGKLVHF